MATLNIEGVGRVTVDDSFLKLSPEAQAKTVEEIVSLSRGSKAASPAAPAAPESKQDMRSSLIKSEISKVVDPIKNFGIGAADTISFGTSDEIFGLGKAALQKLTGNNKAFSDLRAQAEQEARQSLDNSGAMGTAGQVVGGFIPLVRGAQLANRALKAVGVVPTAVKTGMVTGGVGGAAYGAGSADGDLTDRAIGATIGGVGGTALGAAAPSVIRGGSRVVDKVKSLAGVQTPVDKLSPAAQTILRDQADATVTAVSPKAARALEKMSEKPQAVASDLRVRDLFLAEKARVLAPDPQRAIPDDIVFKNVGDKLKRTANQTVDSLVKAGDVDAEAAKELKAIVSRAARHNRAITGQLTDVQLADEFAKGFRTDDSIIDGLKIPKTAKEAVKNAIQDLDTVTFNSLKKNQGGIFEAGGSLLGNRLGMVGGVPGQAVGRAVGGGAGKIVDKLLLQQGTAPVLRRNVERLAQGLDEAGINAGDTVGSLEDLTKQAMLRSGAKKAQERLAQTNERAAEAALRAKTIKETAAVRQSLGMLGRPAGNAYKTFLDETQLTNEQAIPILRQISKDFKGTELAKAATELRKSSNVENTTAFYTIQDTVKDILGGADTKELAKVAKAASGSGIRNPISYEANVNNALEAVRIARESAPNKALAQFATTVAGTKAPAEKLKLVEARLAEATDPAEIDFLNNFVRPLTNFGKK